MSTIKFILINILLIVWLPAIMYILGGYADMKLALGIELFFFSLGYVVLIVAWLCSGMSFNKFINS